MTDEKPRRAQTHGGENRDRRHHDSSGIPVRVIPAEKTPPPVTVPPTSGRSRTAEDLERQIRELRESHNTLAEATWPARHIKDGLDRLMHVTDKLDDRLDKYAERVVRAEDSGTGAWTAVKDLGPKLDAILSELGETRRLATGVERLTGAVERQDKQLVAIEKEQVAAAGRFEAHDKRDALMYAAVDRIEARVGTLEQARTVADTTAKVKRANVRPWWWTSRGMVAVITAIGAAIGAVIAAVYAGGCT